MTVLPFKPLAQQPVAVQRRVGMAIDARRRGDWGAYDMLMAAYVDWWHMWFGGSK